MAEDTWPGLDYTELSQKYGEAIRKGVKVSIPIIEEECELTTHKDTANIDLLKPDGTVLARLQENYLQITGLLEMITDVDPVQMLATIRPYQLTNARGIIVVKHPSWRSWYYPTILVWSKDWVQKREERWNTFHKLFDLVDKAEIETKKTAFTMCAMCQQYSLLDLLDHLNAGVVPAFAVTTLGLGESKLIENAEFIREALTGILLRHYLLHKGFLAYSPAIKKAMGACRYAAALRMDRDEIRLRPGRAVRRPEVIEAQPRPQVRIENAQRFWNDPPEIVIGEDVAAAQEAAPEPFREG